MFVKFTRPHSWSALRSLSRRLGGAAALLVVAGILGGCSSRSYFVYRDSHRYGWRGDHCEDRYYYRHDHYFYGRGRHHHGPGCRCGRCR